MLLSFHLDHTDPLLLLFSEYRSMCEAGWNVSIVILTTVDWTKRTFDYVNEKLYCNRIQKSIPLKLDIQPSDVGVYLTVKHREIVTNELNNHDIFIYCEDDTMFGYIHLMTYLQETKRLRELITSPELILRNYSVGFLRYRRVNRVYSRGPTTFTGEDMISQEFLGEAPDLLRPVCVADEPYMKVEGNTHQAMWILTREQIDILHNKCSFLNHRRDWNHVLIREYMSSFSIFHWGDSPFGYVSPCNVTKLIPAKRFMDFTLLHYYETSQNHNVPMYTYSEHILKPKPNNPYHLHLDELENQNDNNDNISHMNDTIITDPHRDVKQRHHHNRYNHEAGIKNILPIWSLYRNAPCWKNIINTIND
eukprot:gene11957-16005_t